MHITARGRLLIRVQVRKAPGTSNRTLDEGERTLVNSADQLMSARFQANMNRINGLISLVQYDIVLPQPAGFAERTGPRADILRAAIVFLHATFEDLLRSVADPKKRRINFYSGSDISKAIRYRKLNTRRFQELYPPLIQMARRRHRVVHEADLPTKVSLEPAIWQIQDEWQLLTWATVVPAFYSLLLSELYPVEAIFGEIYRKLRQAIDEIVSLGHALSAAGNAESLVQIKPLMEAAQIAKQGALTLKEAGKLLKQAPK
jgi:hypothetical protein